MQNNFLESHFDINSPNFDPQMYCEKFVIWLCGTIEARNGLLERKFSLFQFNNWTRDYFGFSFEEVDSKIVLLGIWKLCDLVIDVTPARAKTPCSVWKISDNIWDKLDVDNILKALPVRKD